MTELRRTENIILRIDRGDDGRPLILTVRPTENTPRNMDPQRLMSYVAQRLQGETYRVIRDYWHFTHEQIHRHVNGYLQMTNVDSAHHAHTGGIYLRDLDIYAIENIFDKATGAGSNPNLSIYQVEFSYWINPSSLEMGAGNSKRGRFKYTSIFETTYLTHETENELGMKVPINCAVFALCFLKTIEGLSPTRRTIIYKAAGMRRLEKEALDLQRELGWSQFVTTDQIQEFVENYRDYRVVILYPSFAGRQPFDFEGEDYIYAGKEKILYLLYDACTQHYAAVVSPRALLGTGVKKSNGFKWCYKCSTLFLPNQGCPCLTHEAKPEIDKTVKLCEGCGGLIYAKNKHHCGFTSCKFCFTLYKRNPSYDDHRCPLYSDKDASTYYPFVGEVGEVLGKSYNLWVYDFESSLILKPHRQTHQYATDSEGYFCLDEEGVPECLIVDAAEHVPNFVVWKNVFTGEQHQSSDIKAFILEMLTVNHGRNICLAHNASGYDSRFIYEAVIRELSVLNIQAELSPLMRGTKFLQLTLGKKIPTIFRDTMLHLPGSLSRLASDFLKGRTDIVIKKGHFPHLANKESMYDYEGTIPDLKYFDLAFSIKTDGEYQAFMEWYNTWEGRTDWNFKKELESYCINDVHLLCEIVKLHHLNCLETVVASEECPYLRISPWHFPTAAGYVHQLFLTYNTYLNGLKEDVEVSELVERSQKASQESWCKLLPNEYYFARLALRGGRTEIRKHYHKGPLTYIDIQSEYPFCQMSKTLELCGGKLEILYPVGNPSIEIFDERYFPCHLHYKTPNEICSCSIHDRTNRMYFPYPKLKIHRLDMQDPHEYLESYGKDYLGILMVDAEPPNDLYHPVLPTFDYPCFPNTSIPDTHQEKKCLYSLTPIKCQTFCSPELQLAVKMGYKITKIYRADRYKAKPSLWADFMKHLYKLKLYNSQIAPEDPEWRRHITETYREKFDLEVSFDNWAKNPAKKATAKGLINSAWGKHAETVDHEQVRVISNNKYQEGWEFYKAVEDQHYKDLSFTYMGEVTMFKYRENRATIKPNLNNTYLPCAIFVPMYGRMMLYNRLSQYGENVVMCDTDSIITDPMGLPTIQHGDCLGDWEPEPGNIIEYVALAPKTYGAKYDDLETSFKCKGVSIKRAHQHYVNFDSAKQLVLEGGSLQIPQMKFDYEPGRGMFTEKFIKEMKFQTNILKGDYDPVTHKVYPFGFKQ